VKAFGLTAGNRTDNENYVPAEQASVAASDIAGFHISLTG
jgi:hypothetical protein